MLSYILTDVSGKTTKLKKPLSACAVSSIDAPADSLTAIFAVEGKVPILKTVRILNGNDTIFFGYIDEQAETLTGTKKLLEIRARSLECILLDNEAKPQTYCMPSMPVLMERHFKPLGFEGFVGTDRAFNGELIISKGMSEWEVLSSFCKKFLGTEPDVREDGTLDLTGKVRDDVIYIGGKNKIISIKRRRKRSVLISDIHARTYLAGGYELHMKNPVANRFGAQKIRYVNAIDSKGKTLHSVEKIMEDTNRAYESLEIECSGSVICRPGDRLKIQGEGKTMKIRELHYVLGSKGEKTRIYAEVIDYVAV